MPLPIHPFGCGLLKANPGRGGVKSNPSLLDAIVFHMMALERYSFDSGDCLSGPSAARSVSLFSRLFVLGIRLTIGSARGIFGVQFAVRDQKPYFTPFLQSWHQGFGRLTKHDAVTRFHIMGLDESRDPTLLSKDQFNHHRLETWSMVFAEAMGLSRQFYPPIRGGSKGGTLVLSTDCIRLSTFSIRPA